MIINHNIAALNTHRQLSFNNTNVGKNLEKLSSGSRINRAGDDAAGLAISEKMRAQIKGLDMAQKNAQDGVSLIQTAEGALNETHSILQRMRELSVQASSDTNTAEDRAAMQEEINQLTTEIDRIANNTEFNTKGLLDGSFTGTFQIGSNSGQNIKLSIGATGSGALGMSGGVQLVTAKDVNDEATGKLSDGTYTVEGTNVLDAKGDTVGVVDLADGKITLGDAAGTVIDLGHAITDGSTIKIEGKDATVTIAKANVANADKLAAGEYNVSGTNLLLGDKLVGTIAADGTLTLQDGVTTIDLTGLGLDATAVTGDLVDGASFTIKGIDVSTAASASGSLDTIDAAIKSVSQQRSQLGAVQNRLEHTINNLGASSENLTAAESRIRDVDHMQVAA